MKKIFLDTETTGLAPGQICQLSLIIDDDTNNIIAKNYFFEVDNMTESAEKLLCRGVDFYKDISNGKRFKDCSNEILGLLSDGTMIAHNLKFDENFISTEFWRCGIQFKPSERFCTMNYFRDICKIPVRGNGSRFKNPKLEELADSLSIDKHKVMEFTNKLFGVEGGDWVDFHDSRYDTAIMYVAFNVYKCTLYGETSWIERFCKKGGCKISEQA